MRHSVRWIVFLLALATVAGPLSPAAAFTNGQAAGLVLGQPDFTSRADATTARGMDDPRAVAVDLVSGAVFVADTGNNRVLRFASGAALANGAPANGVFGQPDFTSRAAATTARGMSQPGGLFVDYAGRLWVADSLNHRVLRFDGAAEKASGAAADGVLGQPGFTSSARAVSASGMDFPHGVALDLEGRLWVVDHFNHRVLRFDGAADKANGASADGVLGQPNFTSNDQGTSAGTLRYPRALAVDSAGTLWLADTNNHRVLRFDNAAEKANGAAADGVLGQPNFTSSTFAATARGMSDPFGLAVDTSGNLWVAERGNHRALRFDGAATKENGAAADGVLGQPDFTSRSTATSARGLNQPGGISLDVAANLWLVDSFNSRALRFDRLITPGVRWAPPAAIIFGTPLGAEQLSAVADVPGTFSYDPPLGTVLEVGEDQALSVRFTPDDGGQYAAVTLSVTIDVRQVPQTITFGDLPPMRVDGPSIIVPVGASSGLPVSLSTTTPEVCTIDGLMLTPVATGVCTIRAAQAGDQNNAPAPPVSRSLLVTAPDATLIYLPLLRR